MGLLRYVRNVAYAFDKMVNAVLFGDPDETISSRMGRHISQGRCVLCKFLCGLLDLFWPDHCIHNVKKEEKP